MHTGYSFCLCFLFKPEGISPRSPLNQHKTEKSECTCMLIKLHMRENVCNVMDNKPFYFTCSFTTMLKSRDGIFFFPKTVLCNKTVLPCMFHLISNNNKAGITAKLQKLASLSQSQISLIWWVTPSHSIFQTNKNFIRRHGNFSAVIWIFLKQTKFCYYSVQNHMRIVNFHMFT